MYKKHDIFSTPGGNNKIWRYMDFTKFISLLDSSALFFSKLDKLGDPFEGSCPISIFESIIKDLSLQLNKQRIIELPKKLRFYSNKVSAVNCWHLNRYESAVMWKVYLKSDEGIAIQSTVKRLMDSIKDKDNDIFITKVKYIDYKSINTPIEPYAIISFPVIYKRKIFQHEHELRAVIQKIPEEGLNSHMKSTIKNGIYVPVDLNILLERIYLAPTSPAWQYKLLKSIVKKYGLNKKAIQSNVDDKP